MEPPSLQTIDEVVTEIMRVHRSLPPRPSIDDIEAANALIRNVDDETQFRLESISKQTKTQNIPQELFVILQEMQKNMAYYNSNEQKRDALRLLDLENVHYLFDDLIQRASRCCVPSSSSSVSDYSNGSTASTTVSSNNLSTTTNTGSVASVSGGLNASSSARFHYSEKEPHAVVAVKSKTSEMFAKDDSYVKKTKPTFHNDGLGAVGPNKLVTSFKPQIVDSSLKRAGTLGQEGEKLSLIKLASLIEVSSKKGSRDLNLQNKLMEHIDWLPDSIGKLSSLISIDLSENRLAVLPSTIGGLSSLTKLDLHSNRITELPQSIGDLLSLVFLDLRGNQLTSLPATFGRLIRLEELDLSSNHLAVLPETVGSLVSLKKLNIETNDIEEIPHTIGHCSSLMELRADYNRLKALPEAVGKIESLEILSVRYNNIKQLPTTMSSLVKLRELDVSFNELESVPESLCFATSLVKMNIGNNFADMRSLPRSIGNLEMLEELDISNNQIRFLPDSFRMLTRLRVLRAEENPLEVPPRHVAEKGAQAVVLYMEELVTKRDFKSQQPVKQKNIWSQICCFSRSNKRKRSGTDYVIA